MTPEERQAQREALIAERQAEREARKAEYDALPEETKKAMHVESLNQQRARTEQQIARLQDRLTEIDAELAK